MTCDEFAKSVEVHFNNGISISYRSYRLESFLGRKNLRHVAGEKCRLKLPAMPIGQTCPIGDVPHLNTMPQPIIL